MLKSILFVKKCFIYVHTFCQFKHARLILGQSIFFIKKQGFFTFLKFIGIQNQQNLLSDLVQFLSIHYYEIISL